ncbi:MAG: riboflavin kinase [Candidatus Nanopelagicales bacterium]
MSQTLSRGPVSGTAVKAGSRRRNPFLLDLYGTAVAVDLVIRLRGQKVFDSVDALVEQMGLDVAAARSALGD